MGSLSEFCSGYKECIQANLYSNGIVVPDSLQKQQDIINQDEFFDSINMNNNLEEGRLLNPNNIISENINRNDIIADSINDEIIESDFKLINNDKESKKPLENNKLSNNNEELNVNLKKNDNNEKEINQNLNNENILNNSKLDNSNKNLAETTNQKIESNNLDKGSNNINKKVPEQMITPLLYKEPNENPTPEGNYDKNLLPGILLMNFDDFPLNDNVFKKELDLGGEFLGDEKKKAKLKETFSYEIKKFAIRYPTGEKYCGYLSSSWVKEIFGRQININGSKYVGFFKNGLYHGLGRIIFNNGSYYEGNFEYGVFEGKGKYVNINGDIYIGDWKNNIKDGFGELILMEGRYIYKGDFKEGKQNGKGKVTWDEGSFYEGNFKNNYFEGNGIYVLRNKKYYIGQWKKSKMNGIGILGESDGKIYSGYFSSDKKNGYGIYSWNNNYYRFEGIFKNGEQNGIGRIINKKNEKQLGIYVKGKKKKFLKENYCSEEVKKLDKEIEKINKTIKDNIFFTQSLSSLLTVIQNEFTERGENTNS